MINDKLIRPDSIVVVGASNNISKPGGKIVKNLLDHHFAGDLFCINPHESKILGVPSFADVTELPEIDLAILAIPAKACLKAVTDLAEHNNTKAFIIISAGFGETNEAGKILEQEIVKVVEKHDACLIGPNCIGVMTPWHASVFTTPIPELTIQGCDFISGSGATAVFIMESGIPKGLRFASVFS
ncbi:MAG TPA: CoA-binding protein, partial [Draconibacterium sp.]|nr:CoA-binding protein [Draconibacterium sp.]